MSVASDGAVFPVSVVITSYNQRELAVEAAVSALSQTHPMTEVVVVDDGSTDGTADLLEQIDGLHVVRQANAGVSAARNHGFAVSSGEFVCFLDGDDRLHPDAVSTGLRVLTGAGVDFATGRSRLVDATGRPLPTTFRAPVTGNLYEALLREAWVAPPGVVLVRRHALERVGPWDTTILGGSEDLDMYLRLSRGHPGVDHGEVVCDYRRHPGNRSASYAACLKDNLRVLAAQDKFVADSARLVTARDAGVEHYKRVFGAKIALSGILEAVSRRNGVASAVFRAIFFSVREPAALVTLLKAQVGRRRAT